MTVDFLTKAATLCVCLWCVGLCVCVQTDWDAPL